MKSLRWILPFGLLGVACLQCRPIGPPGGGADPWSASRAVSNARPTIPISNVRPNIPVSNVRPSMPVSAGGGVSHAAMMREINLRVDMVARGTHGRKVVRPMTPRYITIHSTQNYTADAARHSLALKRGALRSPRSATGNRIGYLIWHYTTDDKVAIQHMPVTEQGEHADFNGPGNRTSIGIEMCEHRGSSRAATTERTAKLAAVLMKRHNIPLRNVVPHYHWPRKGRNPQNKNCPHFLMDNGRPGPKWRAFVNRVNYHYKRMGT